MDDIAELLSRAQKTLSEEPDDQTDTPAAQSMTARIIEFFKANPKPNDKQVHEFAQSLGLSPHDLESRIYGLLSYFIDQGGDKLRGGYADNMPAGQFDQNELEMGIEIEMEHTNNRDLAAEIAKDHLMEIPDYYTRLKRMEAEAKGEVDRDSGSDRGNQA